MANNKVDYSLPWKIERILLELTDGTYDSDSMTATPIRSISISENTAPLSAMGRLERHSTPAQMSQMTSSPISPNESGS